MIDSRKITYASYAQSRFQKAMIHCLEMLTGRGALQRLYDALVDESLKDTSFWQAAVERLELSIDTDMSQLMSVPENEPLVVIANHPFGVVDGIAICHLISLIRPNFKVVLNHVLCQDSRIDRHVLPIDFGTNRAAKVNNLATRKACLKELGAGGTIIIFPAGGVSTAEKVFGLATDLYWKPFTTKLIEKSKASVLPIRFHGQNSWLFHWVSKFSLTLRVGMLVKEVNNKINSTIKTSIGNLIPYSELEPMESTEAKTQYLRDRVYSLDHH